MPTQRQRLQAERDSREGGPDPRPCRQLGALDRSAPARPRGDERRRRRPGATARVPQHPRAERGTDGKGSQLCTEQSAFASVTEAASGPWQLVEPFYGPSLGEITRFGLPDTCFQDLFGGVAASGYRVGWLNGFDTGGKTYLNVSFRKATTSHVTRFGLTGTQYQAELEKAVADGFRPTNVESYLRGGQERYAFTAVKQGGPAYRAYHGVSAAQHDALVTQLKAQGMVAGRGLGRRAGRHASLHRALGAARGRRVAAALDDPLVSVPGATVEARSEGGTRSSAYVDAYMRGGSTELFGDHDVEVDVSASAPQPHERPAPERSSTLH